MILQRSTFQPPARVLVSYVLWGSLGANSTGLVPGRRQVLGGMGKPSECCPGEGNGHPAVS